MTPHEDTSRHTAVPDYDKAPLLDILILVAVGTTLLGSATVSVFGFVVALAKIAGAN